MTGLTRAVTDPDPVIVADHGDVSLQLPAQGPRVPHTELVLTRVVTCPQVTGIGDTWPKLKVEYPDNDPLVGRHQHAPAALRPRLIILWVGGSHQEARRQKRNLQRGYQLETRGMQWASSKPKQSSNNRIRNMLPKSVCIQVANLCVVIVTEALNQSENVLFIKTVSFLSTRVSSQHRHRISKAQ